MTKKPVRRRAVRQALSDDAKKAQMEQWAVKLGLPKNTAQKMIDSYGPFAYDMMLKAIMEPMNIKPIVNGQFRTSAGCVKYFVNNTLSDAQVAKITGKTETEVAANRGSSTVSEPTPSPVEQEAEQQAQRIDHRREQRAASSMVISSQDIAVSSKCDRGSSGFSIDVTCNGKPIPDLPGAANDSITTTSSTREIGNQHDLIGGYGHDGSKPYYGMFQTSPDGMKNYAMYALVHSKDFGKIADQLFDKTKPGFEAARKAFEAEVKKNGYKAYNSAARAKLAGYIKSNQLAIFDRIGKDPKQRDKLVQLQRDYACEVAARNYEMKKVADLLRSQGVDPLDVKPAIWGMIFAIGDARGNIDFDGRTWKPGIKGILKGKTADQINDPTTAAKIRDTYRTVFNTNSGKLAARYAMNHLNEEHSIATARELSLMVGDPKIYERYLEVVASQQGNPNPQPYKIAKGKEQPATTPSQQMTQRGTVRT